MVNNNQFYQKWTVANNYAALYIVHGLGEHSSRYAHLARWLNDRGISVYTGDLPGFGRSPGKRGDVKSFDQLEVAVLNGIDNMKRENQNRSIFLYGHSLGGLITTHIVLTKGTTLNINGVILSSPAFNTAVKVPAWKEMLAKLLTPIFPTLALPSGLPPTYLSHDQEVINAYQTDKYVHSLVSLRFYQEFKRVMQEVRENSNKFPANLPLYIMQSGDDRLVDIQATRDFFRSLETHPLRWYREWEGLYHELHNEPEKETVFQEIERFIQEVI